MLAYIGFREHNTSNFPPKLHNSLQFLNISIWVVIFSTNKNTYRIVFDSILLRVSKLPEIYFPVQWHNSTSQVSKSSKLVTICERGLLKWCQMLQIHFPNYLPRRSCKQELTLGRTEIQNICQVFPNCLPRRSCKHSIGTDSLEVKYKYTTHAKP